MQRKLPASGVLGCRERCVSVVNDKFKQDGGLQLSIYSVA